MGGLHFLLYTNISQIFHSALFSILPWDKVVLFFSDYKNKIALLKKMCRVYFISVSFSQKSRTTGGNTHTKQRD